MIAGRYLGFEKNVDSAFKFLCASITACIKGTYKPGEELSAMLATLKLILSAKDDEIKAAMNRYIKNYPTFSSRNKSGLGIVSMNF